MSLSQFLELLRRVDNISVQFSHLGYVVIRNGEILDKRGEHQPVKALSASQKTRKTANMYASLSVALMYCRGDLRAVFGDVMATLNPSYKERG
ncbi:hypothetical protein SIPHO075v1_p0085 [Vibrio phage PS65A.1]|nr:hypothetical protein SIPHO075v1_p0085 [Vibrio phage PS65A.1]